MIIIQNLAVIYEYCLLASQLIFVAIPHFELFVFAIESWMQRKLARQNHECHQNSKNGYQILFMFMTLFTD